MKVPIVLLLLHFTYIHIKYSWFFSPFSLVRISSFQIEINLNENLMVGLRNELINSQSQQSISAADPRVRREK
jgi:hypothetical protein